MRLALVLLGVLLAQMLVGEIQYRNALPWGLVLVHVTLAATIWALTVGVVYALWRPPLALVAPAAERPRRSASRCGHAERRYAASMDPRTCASSSARRSGGR